MKMENAVSTSSAFGVRQFLFCELVIIYFFQSFVVFSFIRLSTAEPCGQDLVCQNDGTCIATPDRHYCACAPFHFGVNCTGRFHFNVTTPYGVFVRGKAWSLVLVSDEALFLEKLSFMLFREGVIFYSVNEGVETLRPKRKLRIFTTQLQSDKGVVWKMLFHDFNPETDLAFWKIVVHTPRGGSGGNLDMSSAPFHTKVNANKCSVHFPVVCRMDANFCIHPTSICDGQKDCPLGEDEDPDICAKDCRQEPDLYVISVVRISCPELNHLQCVFNAEVCDGKLDCTNGWDERPSLCRGACTDRDFRCADNTCIPPESVCDGVSDCFGPHGLDEVMCGSCSVGYVFCAHDNHCIHRTHVCDRLNHCSDGWDEMHCTYAKGLPRQSPMKTLLFSHTTKGDVELSKFDELSVRNYSGTVAQSLVHASLFETTGYHVSDGEFLVFYTTPRSIRSFNLYDPERSDFEVIHLQREVFGLTVDPLAQRIFVSVKDTAIKSLDYAGSILTDIISQRHSFSLGLAADYRNKVLYWGDHEEQTIQKISYGGEQPLPSHRLTITKKMPSAPNALFLSLADDILYVILRSGSIYYQKIPKLGDRSLIKIIDAPNTATFVLGFVYLDGTFIYADRISKNIWTVKKTAVSGDQRKQFSATLPSKLYKSVSFCSPRIAVVSKSMCFHNEIRCLEGHCIHKTYVCTGRQPKCSLDHPLKPNEMCSVCRRPGEIVCPGTVTCISLSKLCDGNKDCSNGWDEGAKMCPCLADQFRCPSGRCIDKYKVNDGKADCGRKGEWGSDFDELARGDPPCMRHQIRGPNTNTCISDICHYSNSTIAQSSNFTMDICKNASLVFKLVPVCQTSPCKNAGVCASISGGMDYKCKCMPAFEGKRCEVATHCSSLNPCEHEHICFQKKDEYVCKSSLLLGENLFTDAMSSRGRMRRQADTIDYCHFNVCQNGASCFTEKDGYKCECKPGFGGDRCEKAEHCEGNPCLQGGTCLQFAREYACLCPPAFTGVNCSVGQHCSVLIPCNFGGCKQTSVDYECVCSDHFTGPVCTETTHCRDQLCIHGECVQFSDYFHCRCPPFFTGMLCQTALHCKTNPCLFNGTCSPSGDSYTCSCADNRTGLHCEIATHCDKLPCHNGGTCMQLGDGFYCLCPPYFVPESDCEDHLYCVSTNKCLHGGTCTPVQDSNVLYTCQCPEHYSGKDCDISTHCNDNICHENNTDFCDTVGSDYVCVCKPGYTGRKCQESYHCEIASFCYSGGTCEQRLGDYHCSCPAGFSGDRCQLAIHCNSDPCVNGADCVQFKGGFRCKCAAGFSGELCAVADHCRLLQPMPCLNGGSCIQGSTSYTCVCQNNHLLPNCHELVGPGFNYCKSRPCLHGATCIPRAGGQGYNCLCAEYFQGTNCELAVACKAPVSPCANKGVCRLDKLPFSCSCSEYFEGSLCEIPLHCKKLTCQNGGTCNQYRDSFFCLCALGFAGIYCETAVLCEVLKPCLNSATCRQPSQPPFTYECVCNQDFTGERCERGIHCQYSPCTNDGTCLQHFDKFQCHCSSNFTGTVCETGQHCLSNPCLHEGKCIQGTVSYTCRCDEAYSGHNCEISSACNSEPCANQGICVQTRGNYACYCKDGFTGFNCEVAEHCKYVQCLNGGTCMHGPTTFFCTCPSGFSGEKCEIPIHCKFTPCLRGGTCYQYEHDFSCDCIKGYGGKNCSLPRHCIEFSPCRNEGSCIQEQDGFRCDCTVNATGELCEIGTHCALRPCKNFGSCIQYTSDFRCTCLVGFTGERCETSLHCSMNTTDFCLNNGSCVTTNKGADYRCDCPGEYTGRNCGVPNYFALYTKWDIFWKEYVGETLDKVDRCALIQPCWNEGTCTAKLGDFECKCPAAFGGKFCAEGQHCINSVCKHGGTCHQYLTNFTCACARGFEGKTCDLANHCNLMQPCKNNGNCTQLEETYECTCPDGFQGATCEEAQQCTTNPCQHQGQCLQFATTYTCVCPPGYTGTDCQISSLCEYFKDWCQNDGRCVEEKGTFSCVCLLEYKGADCSILNISMVDQEFLSREELQASLLFLSRLYYFVLSIIVLVSTVILAVCAYIIQFDDGFDDPVVGSDGHVVASKRFK